jgi:hypothetical protein
MNANGRQFLDRPDIGSSNRRLIDHGLLGWARMPDGLPRNTRNTRKTEREGIGKAEKLKAEIGRGFLTANRRE